MSQILTVQSVVIMLPSIGEALQIPPTRQQMITSTYNISAGCLILFWGRLADIYGRRTTFLIGSTGFTLAALAIPFSPVEICFYVLRVLQGMSGAATIPSAIGILATTFPVGKSRNMAFVTFAAASSLGSIIGNVAGGVVGGYLSWKWVFWITSIISGTVTMAAYILTRHKSFTQLPQGSTDTYVDWLGGVIISSSLILLLVALSEANVIGWKVPWIPVLLVLSVLLGAAFVFWQLRLEKHACRQPLLRPAMFRNMQFSASFTLIGLFYAAFNGFLIFSTFL
jgi:MFS family permease